MKFVYFESLSSCEYPVGWTFNSNRFYIKNVAETLCDTFPDENKIALICRGTSGTILAGAVGTLLNLKKKKVIIVVSRKASSHSHSMAGIVDISMGYLPVIIDDFISSGDTIQAIIAELQSRIKVDNLVLCISNRFSEESIKNYKDSEDPLYTILSAFDTIICNKPLQ